MTTAKIDDPTHPTPSGEYAPGTYEVDTTDPKKPVVTIYQHDDNVFTEAEIIALVKKAGYTIDAFANFGNISTGTDGILAGQGVVCFVKTVEVNYASVDGKIIQYALAGETSVSLDLSKYMVADATLVNDTNYTNAGVNSFGMLTWDPSSVGDLKLVNAYAFDAQNVEKVYMWDAEKGEYGTTDLKSKNFIPCNAQLKVVGATADAGKYYQLSVDGKPFGAAVLAKDTSANTYELKNGMAALLNKDHKIVLGEIAGFKLVINGVALKDVYDVTSGTVDITKEAAAAKLPQTTYLIVKASDGDTLTGATACTLKKTMDSGYNWQYTIDQMAGTNAVGGVITLKPAVEISFAKGADVKFGDLSNVKNAELRAETSTVTYPAAGDKIYVVAGTQVTLTTKSGSDFSGSPALNATEYGVAYKPMKADGSGVDAAAKYTVTTGDGLTVSGSTTAATLSATFTITSSVQFDVVNTADQGATWTALATA